MEKIKISVVSKPDGFDFTIFMARLVRIGEIQVSSVDDLVKKVSSQCIARSASIERLDIFAHGTGGIIHIGQDQLGGVHGPGEDPIYKLSGLKGFFSEDGMVALCVCEAGKGDGTMVEFSRNVGVPVYATTGDVSPNLSFSGLGLWWGITVAAYPDGNFRRNVEMPNDPRSYPPGIGYPAGFYQ
jgi:hypothetical protein